MDTSRVDIVYRPLRIAWAIKADDFDAFRKVAKVSCTLAGGRYNPLVIVDNPEAGRLVECFRADIVLPVGDAPEVKAFVAKFPHLINPWFSPDDLHYSDGNGGGGCRVLDIDNLLTRWHREREWRDVVDAGMREFTWSDEDPLKDVFLVEYGMFPDKGDVHIDYKKILRNAAHPTEIPVVQIAPDQPLPADAANHPAIAFMGRFCATKYALSGHHARNNPGFFTGNADDLDDLVAFWNLRATNTPMHFIDLRYRERYSATLPLQQQGFADIIAHRHEFDRHVAVWSRQQAEQERGQIAKSLVGESAPLICTMSELSWNGLNIKPPTMILGQASSLGVIVNRYERDTASFALGDKPFSGDVWFHMQHLVASVSMFRSRREQEASFQLPYVPELNEPFGRSTGVGYAELRLEPDRVGIVIDAEDTDRNVQAVPILELVEALFTSCGIKATLSNAGLITRQLITQMGGIDSTRVFKIPGVRRLLRSMPLNKSVTRRVALQLIGQSDPDTGANFADHKHLFIEQRDINSDLTPSDVFTHLVKKRVFRIGADVLCSTCRLASWVPLDDLKQDITCGLCGARIDTTQQLTEEQFTYRRSGLLGVEKNMQGAIPVALVLQQLSNNVFNGALRGGAVWMPSLNVEAVDGSWGKPRELDFFAVELTPREGMNGERRTRVIIGEAKDRGSQIDANDADTMRMVADAFSRERFEVYIVFARLTKFTEDEIAVAATLSQEDRNVILLTDQELEPYYVYDRGDAELKKLRFDLDGIVQGTRRQYPSLTPPSFIEKRAARVAKTVAGGEAEGGKNAEKAAKKSAPI